MELRRGKWWSGWRIGASRGWVGVDIGSVQTKLTTFTPSEDWRAAAVATPKAVFEGHRIADPGAVGAALAAVVEQMGLRSLPAAVALPAPAVVVRRLTIAADAVGSVTERVADELRSQAAPASELARDFQVLGANPAGGLDVVAVAARVDVVESYARTVHLAGLRAVVVEPEYFALQNAVAPSLDGAVGGSVLVVHVGERYAALNVLADGRSRFTTELPVVRADHSAASGPMVVDDEPPSRDGEYAAFADDLHHRLYFYCPFLTDLPLTEIVVAGGRAREAALAAALRERFAVPVRTFYQRLPSAAGAGSGDTALGAEFAVAVGLAVRCSVER